VPEKGTAGVDAVLLRRADDEGIGLTLAWLSRAFHRFIRRRFFG